MTGERAVPFTAVTFADSFWAPRQTILREVTLPTIHEHCARAGMFDALDVTAPPGEMPLGYFPSPDGVRPTSPVMWWDSDIAKWLEAAACALARHADPALFALVDDAVTRLVKAQAPDGYLNSYFQRRAPVDRWTNTRDWHELYCAGHLIEAAVALYEGLGDRRLLDAMERYVALIDATFGPEPGKRRGYCGHTGIELALIRLHRANGDPRALALARYFIDERGRQPHWFDAEARARGEDPALWPHRTYEYNQSHRPVREQDQVVGHAVRAMYLCCAMADLAAIDGDAGLDAACRRLWDDLTGKRLYVTGGLGPSASNEGFTRDFDLPNETAYAETCAAIGLVMWAHRMALATGEARFSDTMERALFNGVLVGGSLAGDRFAYDNPLASRGDVERRIWFACPCCPPNLARMIASVGGCLCSTGDDSVSLHLYARADIAADVGGARVGLRLATDYPWQGEIAIDLAPARPVHFALRLRRPDWCPAARVRVNGETVEPIDDRGYLRIERTWRAGDRVELSLDMPVQVLHARAAITADLGRVALRRGPTIYCVEEVDAGCDVERFALDAGRPVAVGWAPDLLGGCATLTLAGRTATDAPDDPLYGATPPALLPAKVRAVPYALWGNRGAGGMAVWLRSGGA